MNIPLVILSGAAKGCEVEESVHSKDEGERILRLVSLAQDDMGGSPNVGRELAPALKL